VLTPADFAGFAGIPVPVQEKLQEITTKSNGQAQAVDGDNHASLLLEENVRESEIVIVTTSTMKDTKEYTVIKTRKEP
jgi:hypothetical protein